MDEGRSGGSTKDDFFFSVVDSFDCFRVILARLVSSSSSVSYKKRITTFHIEFYQICVLIEVINVILYAS